MFQSFGYCRREERTSLDLDGRTRTWMKIRGAWGDTVIRRLRPSRNRRLVNQVRAKAEQSINLATTRHFLAFVGDFRRSFVLGVPLRAVGRRRLEWIVDI